MGHHLERHVELQQQGIEQDDVADRYLAGVVARHKQQKRYGELDGKPQSKHSDIADALQYIAAPGVSHFRRLGGKTPPHPVMAAEVTKRLHRVHGVSDEARVFLTGLDRFIQKDTRATNGD